MLWSLYIGGLFCACFWMYAWTLSYICASLCMLWDVHIWGFYCTVVHLIEQVQLHDFQGVIVGGSTVIMGNAGFYSSPCDVLYSSPHLCCFLMALTPLTVSLISGEDFVLYVAFFTVRQLTMLQLLESCWGVADLWVWRCFLCLHVAVNSVASPCGCECGRFSLGTGLSLLATLDLSAKAWKWFGV